MNRIFGSKKPAEKQPEQPQQQKEEEVKTEVQAPQLDLSDHSQKLEVKIQQLNQTINGIEKEMQDTYAKMKKARGGSQSMYKQRCLMLLKKKRMYEQQLQQMMSQQFSIDSLAFTKENIQNSIDTANSMKQAVQVQTEMMKNIDIDELDDLRDEMEEMMQESNEINEMMNRNYAVNVDEDEIDQEMEELDNEFFKDAMMQQNSNSQQQQVGQQKMNLNQL